MMQALKLRSDSSEMVHKVSPKTTKGSPDSTSKTAERKSNKSVSVPEKKVLRVSDMQQQLVQLQEEVKKAREERSQALAELVEAKKSQRKENEDAEIAKESERRMLESLISQTRQLEQTKMLLEEEKLELRTLRESLKGSESSTGHSSRNLSWTGPGSSRNLGKHVEANGGDDLVRAHEEIRVLRNELKLATAAEEKAKKAMDDLAIALKEVTTDANRTKGQLSNTQSELQSVRVEAERLEDLLKMTDEKFRAAVEESERVNMELEKSIAAWMEKENGFVECMKVSEEEMSKLRDENERLINSQRVLREDNSKLRDILKHAVNEATVVKEGMEIARKENSTLKDILVEKDNALQSIRQDYGCLKVSEAAALDSVRELKSLLAATSTVTSSGTAVSKENGSFEQPKSASAGSLENDSLERLKAVSRGSKDNDSLEQLKTASIEVTDNKNARFPSGNWSINNPRPGRRHSIAEERQFTGSLSDTEELPQPKGRKLQSASNLTELRVPSSLFSDCGRSTNFDDFDYIDRNQLAGIEQYNGTFVKQKKKKPMFWRFGDMIRRKSFRK